MKKLYFLLPLFFIAVPLAHAFPTFITESNTFCAQGFGDTNTNGVYIYDHTDNGYLFFTNGSRWWWATAALDWSRFSDTASLSSQTVNYQYSDAGENYSWVGQYETFTGSGGEHQTDPAGAVTNGACAPPPPPPPPVSGGRFAAPSASDLAFTGFFSDKAASSSSMLAAVASGVNSTGKDVWPLLILIGVPLAFVIYRYVVGAAKHTVGATSTGGKKGFTVFDPDDVMGSDRRRGIK